jgi:L-cystine transport system permease protein
MRPFDPVYILKSFCALAPFIGRTLLVMILSVIFGTLFGSVLAWARLSRSRAAKACAACYVHLMRCTPSIVLLFIIYYGIPKIVSSCTGVRTGYNGKLAYVTVTLSLLFAASMCELFRASYDAVDKGQRDAAYCCGLTPFQTAQIIIIPQAVTSALPVFCNEVIALLKQGALAFTIGFIDLMGETDVMIARNYGAHGLETYIALAAIYWTIAIVIEQIASVFERRSVRGKSLPGSRNESSWD